MVDGKRNETGVSSTCLENLPRRRYQIWKSKYFDTVTGNYTFRSLSYINKLRNQEEAEEATIADYFWYRYLMYIFSLGYLRWKIMLMQDTYSILNNILIIHNIQFVLDKD